MGLRINTNVQSLAAQRSLSQVKRAQDSSLEKLASGSRINRSSDDAAGLAISEKLKATIRGTKQAARNANDGISLIQVAEGGLNEISNIVVRLRELSVQAASDTIGQEEREFTNLEYQQLTQEIDRIAMSTTFNGKNILDGSGEKQDFQVGVYNNEFNDRISYDTKSANAKTEALQLTSLNVSDKESARTNLEKLDIALNAINGNRANLGALQSRLQSTINNLEISNESLSAANSRVRDTDLAVETAELAKSNILNAANTSILAQANNSQAMALKLIS